MSSSMRSRSRSNSNVSTTSSIDEQAELLSHSSEAESEQESAENPRCALILSSVEPTLANLKDLLPETNAGYIRYKKNGLNKLFYADKKAKQCELLLSIPPVGERPAAAEAEVKEAEEGLAAAPASAPNKPFDIALTLEGNADYSSPGPELIEIVVLPDSPDNSAEAVNPVNINETEASREMAYRLNNFDIELQVFSRPNRILSAAEGRKALIFHPQLLSEWKEKNGCDLLQLTEAPTLATRGTLAFTNAAYLRHGDRLWYANKETKELTELFLSDREHGLSLISLPNSNAELDEDSLYQAEKKRRPILLRRPDEKGGFKYSIYGFRNGRWQETKLNLSAAGRRIDPGLSSEENRAAAESEAAAERKALERLSFIDEAEVVLSKDDPLLKAIRGSILTRGHRLALEEVQRFDLEMGTHFCLHRHLADSELDKIRIMTGHLHMTLWQKILSGSGDFCSGAIALSSGVMTAGTFVALNLVTGGLAALGALILLFAGTAVNWWIFKRYVPAVLIDIFGREKFLVDENGKALSSKKKIAIGIAMGLSLSVGITFAALAYASTFSLSTGFTFLASISVAFPPLAFFLAAVTLICMTALMIKDIASLIKKEDPIGECKKFLRNLISIDPPQDEDGKTLDDGKTLGQRKIERVFKVILTGLFIPLACLGLYMTMNACSPAVKAILLEKIPGISEALATGFAIGVSSVLAFIGQIPFGIQTALQTIGRIIGAVNNFIHPQEPLPGAKRESAGDKAWKWFKLGNVGANGVGNGGISFAGANGSPLLGILSLISGTANSVFAGTPAVLASEDMEFKRPQPKYKFSDTATTTSNIHSRLYGKDLRSLMQAAKAAKPVQPLPAAISTKISKLPEGHHALAQESEMDSEEKSPSSRDMLINNTVFKTNGHKEFELRPMNCRAAVRAKEPALDDSLIGLNLNRCLSV